MPRVSDAKEKILKAAKELFWLHNYGSVSVDDICNKSDVKKGSFYHFYKSKTDLCVACLDDHWNQLADQLDSIFSPAKDPLARISNYANAVYDIQTELKKQYGVVLGCPISLSGTEMSNEEEKIRTKALEVFNSYNKYFESVIRDLKEKKLSTIDDVELAANRVHSYVLGVIYHAKIANDTELIKSELEKGILALLKVK